jgi:phage I-like protein
MRNKKSKKPIQGERNTELKLLACNNSSSKLIALSAKEAAHDVTTQNWQPIAVVGKWKGHANGSFELKREDLQTMVTNFTNAEAHEIVVDYEHATLYGNKAEAAGWLKELRVEGDALEAKIEWLDDAKELIKSKKYKYLSPVINPNTIDQVSGDNIGWSLHSVALTNKPFFEELDEVRINNNPIQKKENTVNEEEKRVFEALKAENERLKAENETLKTENAKLKEDTAASQKSEAGVKIDAAVAAKKIHPDQRDSLMAFSAADPVGFDKFLESAKGVTQAPGGNNMFAGSADNPDQQKYDVLKLGGFTNG